MRLDKATQGAVRFIVGRFHVGTSEDTIRADIRRRTAPRNGQPAISDRKIAAIEAYAIKCHRENGALFDWVNYGCR